MSVEYNVVHLAVFALSFIMLCHVFTSNWSAALRAAHIAIPRPPYATRPVEKIPTGGIDTVLPRTAAHANAANAQLTAGVPAAKVLQQQNPKR